MRKKILFLICIVSLLFVSLSSGTTSVYADYSDAPHAETSLPTTK